MLSRFELGRVYAGETFRFSLPEKQFRACDFGGFGIWCRFANLLFTGITLNFDDIFVSYASHTPHCVLYSVCCILCVVFCVLYSVCCILYVVFCVHSFIVNGI